MYNGRESRHGLYIFVTFVVGRGDPLPSEASHMVSSKLHVGSSHMISSELKKNDADKKVL